MPVPFDLTSTRARPRCIAGSTLSGEMGGKGREGKRLVVVGHGRSARRQPPPSLGHLIGRQSFLIGSQEIY